MSESAAEGTPALLGGMVEPVATDPDWSAKHPRGSGGRFIATARPGTGAAQVERLRQQADAGNTAKPGPTRRDIEAALAGLDVPEVATDGDCLWAPGDVSRALRDREIDSRVVFVAGWVQPKTLAFLHRATLAGAFVVDTTATQYDATLPSLIVATAAEYVVMLERATGVPVTLE